VLLGEFDLYYAGLSTSSWTAMGASWVSANLPASRQTYSTGIRARCHVRLHDDLEAALAEVQATYPSW